MEELELLQKIKNELIDRGYYRANPFNKTYILNIDVETWHEIFKTEEYNEKKKEDGNI